MLRQLDAAGVVIDAALWIYFPEDQHWKLLLSSPTVAERGPKAAYEVIQKVIDKLRSALPVFLEDVAVSESDAPLLKLLRTAIRTGPGIGGIRFTNNVINGQLIHDAYIYRLTGAKPKSSEPEPAPKFEGNRLKTC